MGNALLITSTTLSLLDLAFHALATPPKTESFSNQFMVPFYDCVFLSLPQLPPLGLVITQGLTQAYNEYSTYYSQGLARLQMSTGLVMVKALVRQVIAHRSVSN